MIPPETVAASDHPPAALLAFIAQELEHWDFDVRPVFDGTVAGAVAVVIDEITYYVEIRTP